ncbi:MAG: membrane dipeptidase [Ramlibacter sp.]
MATAGGKTIDPHAISRRRFGLWMGCAGLAGAAGPALAQAPAPQPRRPYLGDMHSHIAMFRQNPRTVDLRQHLEQTGTTLLAWSLVDDTPWTRKTATGMEQMSEPGPGEIWDYFRKRVARYDSHLKHWGLTKALTPADIDATMAGKPHVLMAAESANFLEGRPERVAQAHAMGLRHLQLVHFIETPLGDRQTSPPKHGGMAPVALQVINECKRVGVVVDLAHCSPDFVNAAMAASDAAMVWSHSWVRGAAGTWRDWTYIARALSQEQARRFAARGGVIGLWTARVKSDRNYKVRDAETYAGEIARMVDMLGPQAVAFGTDMDGVGNDPTLAQYNDLREVADRLAQLNWPDAVLHDVCIGNYARVLKKAMTT